MWAPQTGSHLRRPRRATRRDAARRGRGPLSGSHEIGRMLVNSRQSRRGLEQLSRRGGAGADIHHARRRRRGAGDAQQREEQNCARRAAAERAGGAPRGGEHCVLFVCFCAARGAAAPGARGRRTSCRPRGGVTAPRSAERCRAVPAAAQAPPTLRRRGASTAAPRSQRFAAGVLLRSGPPLLSRQTLAAESRGESAAPRSPPVAPPTAYRARCRRALPRPLRQHPRSPRRCCRRCLFLSSCTFLACFLSTHACGAWRCVAPGALWRQSRACGRSWTCRRRYLTGLTQTRTTRSCAVPRRALPAL